MSQWHPPVENEAHVHAHYARWRGNLRPNGIRTYRSTDALHGAPQCPDASPIEILGTLLQIDNSNRSF